MKKIQELVKLDDKALEEVSGGITATGVAKGVGRGIVKTLTTSAGTVTGIFLGAVSGASVGSAVTGNWDKKHDASVGELTVFVGAAGVGAYYGGRIGLKFGNYICKILDIEE